jgi:predicted dehydrogenase
MVHPTVRTIHVGVGGRGSWPVDLLTADPRFTPVALVDLVEENLRRAAERSGLPETACFGSLEAAQAAQPADALVICTPTRTHAAYCRAGFAAGMHVLVEKGMTMDWAEARALVREADQAGVRFCVSQNYRYNAEMRTLRRALNSGRYGQPHLIDLIHHRHRPEPRTLDYPGAMVWDMACHHFDNLVFLFGPVARATAVTHNAPWSPYAHDAGVSAVLERAGLHLPADSPGDGAGLSLGAAERAGGAAHHRRRLGVAAARRAASVRPGRPAGAHRGGAASA